MARFSPSLLSADFAALGDGLLFCEKAGADLVHLDVMDGHFVPNLTIGPPVIAALRKRTRLPFDVHLMIERPLDWVERYREAGADRISVHVEAEPHLRRTLGRIRDLGAEAGVAINPGTSVASLEDCLPYSDFVLVMSVDPGFGGQKFLPRSIEKVARIRELAARLGARIDVAVDGGVDSANARELASAGATTLVAGNAFFGAADPAGFARTIRSAGTDLGSVA